jgi:hypothetical protein
MSPIALSKDLSFGLNALIDRFAHILAVNGDARLVESNAGPDTPQAQTNR